MSSVLESITLAKGFLKSAELQNIIPRDFAMEFNSTTVEERIAVPKVVAKDGQRLQGRVELPHLHPNVQM